MIEIILLVFTFWIIPSVLSYGFMVGWTKCVYPNQRFTKGDFIDVVGISKSYKCGLKFQLWDDAL